VQSKLRVIAENDWAYLTKIKISEYYKVEMGVFTLLKALFEEIESITPQVNI